MRAANLPGRRDLLTFRLGGTAAPADACLAIDAEARSARRVDHWLRVYRGAMACRFEVTLSGEDTQAIPLAREALAEADRLEAALSVFRESSDLMQLNRTAAAAPALVDAELFALLRRCQQLHADTGGAFDITSTPLSRCWGFLRREGRVPSESEIAAARACVGMALVELLDAAEGDESRRASIDTSDATVTAGAVRFAREGVALNLGSIGKGYAVQRIAAQLARAGVSRALVSAGGSSIAALGAPPADDFDRDGWLIHIRPTQTDPAQTEPAPTDPTQSGASANDAPPIARVWLRDGALSTSGAGEQFVEVEGRRYGHVIDPRTGWPAAGTRSATVITRDAADADALSTACLVAGADLARRYCAAHPDTLVLLTTDADPWHPQIIGSYPGARLLAARVSSSSPVPQGMAPVRRGAS